MTKVDKWSPLVLEKLNEKLGDKTDEFITLLKATGSILSGGFVLQSIVKYEADPDIDVYVPIDQMPTFIDTLIIQNMLQFRQYRHYDASIYCRSFLRKNGIKRVHTFVSDNVMMDVMSVRKRKTLKEVCSNFDLTYCQVWFDGTDVFATHPEHIENKKGYLQGDYIEPFIKGNRFLKDRLRKYKERGFTTEYDTVETLPSIDSIVLDNRCTKPNQDEMLSLWFKKVATKWLTANRKELVFVPFGNDRYYRVYSDELICSDGITWKGELWNGEPISKFEVQYDEGYDSEDMDTDKLIELANDDESKDELVYRRSMFELLEHLFTATGDIFFLNFYHIFYGYKMDNLEKYQPYVDCLRNNCTREGDDMFGDEGRLYDIHSHPLDGAITTDSMEGYIQQFYCLSDNDKLKGVSCYYKPNPGEHPDNCTKQITLKEIQTIVSREAYLKFTEPQPVKLGLNTAMPFYEAALTNVKTEEKGYGDEFHETMCPFCLLPVSRGSGCSYMMHENPNRLPDTATPYCKEELLVKVLLDKYKKMAPIIDRSYAQGLPIKIEFCVECGRPCLGHQHFDITSATPKLVPPKKKPDPNRPGTMIFDYATCAGGGRVELIARILAVRDIYKYSLIKDPTKERVKAALAADKAPNMKCYVDRATAILNMELKDRKFNTKVKFVKKYNHPAYKDVVEEKSLSKSINDVARAAHDQLAHDEVENKNEDQSSDESDDDQFFRRHMAQAGINIDAPIEDEEEEEEEPLVRQAERMNEGMQGGKTRWKKHRRFVPCKKNTTQKLRKRRH